MARPKGIAKTGGRQKGTPNKYTGELRQMILGALDDAGGRGYLKARALDTPQAFLSLIGRVLPLQHEGTEGTPIKHLVETAIVDKPDKG